MSALGQKRTISQRKRHVRVTFNSGHEERPATLLGVTGRYCLKQITPY
jgi:hypothetical protein